VFTVGIQVYRNVQNYQLNKQRLISDVQFALDNGVEGYYAELAKNDVFSQINFDSLGTNPFPGMFGASGFALSNSAMSEIEIPMTSRGDNHPGARASFYFTDSIERMALPPDSAIRFVSVGVPDTLLNFRNFANQIVISLTRDTVDFELMNSFVELEMERANLDMEYDLVHYQLDSMVGHLQAEKKEYALGTVSKSTYLPRNQKLEMKFENASLIILKRGMVDLIISLLICLVVIGALLYLYRIINKQKALAEIKNDLINNITHEFKTPIATIATAIDGIVNFNQEKDEEKTKKYLGISTQQLTKLNHMVEKLLETATLDSDKLLLTIEEVDVKKLLAGLSEKHQLIAGDKTINFHTKFPSKVVQADIFHLENALSNLIDNAVKYGGNEIDIYLLEKDGKIEIKVEDNGAGIDKSQRDRIFEQFYRIPTGNRHDVKGFGIGLYYTKKIIEKHGGSILLDLNSGKTSFEVAL